MPWWSSNRRNTVLDVPTIVGVGVVPDYAGAND